MIFHIFPYEKFSYDYITKINNLFNSREHEFFLYGKLPSDKIKNVTYENVKFESQFLNKHACRCYLRLTAKKADKIILHSWFFPKYLMALSCYWVTVYPKKVFWNIWGHDLYNMYWERNKSLKTRMREVLRKYFIKHVRAVGYIPGDYTFLKKCYQTNAKFFLASYAYEFYDFGQVERKNDGMNIMLGNSATRECRYMETIDLLSEIDDQKMKIYCILAYPSGNRAYIDMVSAHGKKAFGERFIPIVDYMGYDDYMKFLASIDAAVFNHNRQQGLGNIASLLYLGKKVFVSEENACGDYFKRMGVSLFDMAELKDGIKFELNPDSQAENRRMIKKFFSDAEFRTRWEKIFQEEY